MDQTQRRSDAVGRISARAAMVALGIGGLGTMVAVGTAVDAGAVQKPKKIVIASTKNAQLGTILVSGKTVYTLQAGSTPCGAQCLKVWPAVVVPKGAKGPTAGTGVNQKKLGMVKRAGGLRQVTYGGRPLYRFVGDRTVGQANGNVTDKWGTWAVVVTVGLSAAAGSQPAAPPATTPTPATAPRPPRRRRRRPRRRPPHPRPPRRRPRRHGRRHRRPRRHGRRHRRPRRRHRPPRRRRRARGARRSEAHRAAPVTAQGTQRRVRRPLRPRRVPRSSFG